MRKYDKFNHIVGQRVKSARIDANMTQEKLAEAIHLENPQQVSDIERGMCGLSVAKLVEVCKALNVEADYILFGLSARNTENPINKYLCKMSPEQLKFVESFIEIYADSLGISDD